MHKIRIFHLGGGGSFEYSVRSLPHSSDNWLVEIRGKRPDRPVEVLEEELVEFANCRSEIEAVKRYVNKYGPPELVKLENENLLYAGTMGRWRSLQRGFRINWDRMLGIEIKNDLSANYGKEFSELWKAQAPWVNAEAEGEFRLTDQGLLFLCKTHYMALVIKLLAVAASEKLRKCLNPECLVTPYFIAGHGKTLYCSQQCGHWGQKQAKLKYWRENKQMTGASLSESTKTTKPNKNKARRRSDGTNKAR